MKVSVLALLLLAGGSWSAESALAQSRRSPLPQGQRAQASNQVPQRTTSETQTLQRAAALLERRGFTEESKRLRDITNQLGRDSINVQSAPNLEDLSTRVDILERIANGFAAAGDEASADAIRFYASVGRAQLDGEDDTADVPDSLREGPGTVQDKLTRMVQESAALFRDRGDRRSARLARALGEYYVKRSEARADSDFADLTYIEGRVPVLRLARDAYKLSPEGNEEALAWMEWMYVMGRNRVSEPPREVPEVPGSFTGMDQLISYIAQAAEIYEQTGRTEECVRCKALAEYYEKRAKGEAVDNSRESAARGMGAGGIGVAIEEEPTIDTERRAMSSRPSRRRAGGTTDPEMQRIHELEQRIMTVQQKLIEIRKKLDGGRR